MGGDDQKAEGGSQQTEHQTQGARVLLMVIPVRDAIDRGAGGQQKHRNREKGGDGIEREKSRRRQGRGRERKDPHGPSRKHPKRSGHANHGPQTQQSGCHLPAPAPQKEPRETGTHHEQNRQEVESHPSSLARSSIQRKAPSRASST